MRKLLAVGLFCIIALAWTSMGYCQDYQVSLTLDKIKYAPSETVFATVLIQNPSNIPQANQLVTIRWTAPDASLLHENEGLTDATGQVSVTYALNATIRLGIYSVIALCGNNNATAYFEVEMLRTHALTILLYGASVPVWINGVHRSDGNTTLIISDGTYTVEVPSEYAGAIFVMWKTDSINYTNPRLTITLNREITLTAIYEQSTISQTTAWLMPYLIWIVVAIVIVVVVVWAYREGII